MKLDELKGLAQRLFDDAGALIAFLARTDAEELRRAEEFINSGDDKILLFPKLKQDGKAENLAEAFSFSKEELRKMPKLKYGRTRITKDGYYQIRYRREGYEKQFTAKTAAECKQKFKEWLKEEKNVKKAPPKRKALFGEFILQFYELVKKQNVKEQTYVSLIGIVKRYVIPTLGAFTVREISPMKCQTLLNRVLDEGKGRTAEHLKVILKEAFRAAVGEKLITDNPMNYVKIPRHQQKHGSALSKAEVASFLEACRGSYYKRIFPFMLYTGIRRGELKSATFEGDFVKIANGKCRKGEKQKYRRIPIADGLRPYLPISQREINAFDQKMSEAFKALCPAHHLHDLRHTFTSYCLQCGIAKEVVDVWTGHVNRSDMTTAVYTHFTDEFMLQEIRKLKFE